jgi:transposase
MTSEPILPEGLWQRVEPLLPGPKLKCRDILGAGRKPSEPRRVLTGILFALKTGVAWKLLPATSEFPSGYTCRRKLVEWHRAGVWQRLLENLLAELQPRKRLKWRRAIVNSPSPRASRRGQKTGSHPTDRRKLRTRQHLLTHTHLPPLPLTLTGPDRHHLTQLLALVQRIPPGPGKRGRPRRSPGRVQAGRGHDSKLHRQALKKRA